MLLTWYNRYFQKLNSMCEVQLSVIWFIYAQVIVISWIIDTKIWSIGIIQDVNANLSHTFQDRYKQLFPNDLDKISYSSKNIALSSDLRSCVIDTLLNVWISEHEVHTKHRNDCNFSHRHRFSTIKRNSRNILRL